MKKLIMTAAVVACAGIVSAQVYSANIVGYNKVSATGLDLVSIDFNLDATGLTPDAVYGATLPAGTKVYTYTPGVGYATAEYVDSFGFQYWDSSPELGGMGAHWLALPSGTATPVYSGEVLLADSVTNSITPGLQLASWPYPTAVSLTAMGFTPTAGDKVYTYTPGVGYATAEYVDSFGFQYWDADPTIGVGQGFWYSSEAGAPVDWVSVRPFTP